MAFRLIRPPWSWCQGKWYVLAGLEFWSWAMALGMKRWNDMKQLPWPDVVWMSSFIRPFFLFLKSVVVVVVVVVSPQFGLKIVFFVRQWLSLLCAIPKGSAATHWWLSRGGSCPMVSRYVVDTFDRSPFWNNISQLYELYELYQHLWHCIKACILLDVSTEHGVSIRRMIHFWGSVRFPAYKNMRTVIA